MNPTDTAKTIRRILLELKRPRSRPSGADRSRNPDAALSGPLAAALLATSWLWTAGPALAVSLGEMADEAAGDLETVPGLIAIAFYIIGAAIVGFGLLKLKRHVDHPQQTTIGSGLIAILIGVALIAAPRRHQRARRHLRHRRRQPYRPQAEALAGAPASCRSPSPPPPTTCSA